MVDNLYYREVFKITEFKDGAVYKTKSQGHKWVSGIAPHGYIYASPNDGTIITIKKAIENE